MLFVRGWRFRQSGKNDPGTSCGVSSQMRGSASPSPIKETKGENLEGVYLSEVRKIVLW